MMALRVFRWRVDASRSSLDAIIIVVFKQVPVALRVLRWRVAASRSSLDTIVIMESIDIAGNESRRFASPCDNFL